jgi:hypothetical protein
MPRFVCERHPQLVLQDERGVWARFRGGVFETASPAVVKRLRALPAAEGIREVDTSPRPSAQEAP